MMQEFKDFLIKFGCQNYNDPLYLEAFTHTSFINEHKDERAHLQRLEFIGDSVLSLIISRYIYLKYPRFTEKDLTRLRSILVREETLAIIGKKLNITQYLRLGEGEIKNNGRNNPSIIADLVESFIGCLFLVEGYRFTEAKIINYFQNIEDGIHLDDLNDYKSKLQELVQSDTRQAVTYKTIEMVGPPNSPIFTVEAYIGEICMGRGVGSSKKKAEQAAAKEVLGKMVI